MIKRTRPNNAFNQTQNKRGVILATVIARAGEGKR
jgi:hypothetical protein